MSTTSSRDGRSSFRDANHSYEHDENSVGEQVRNTGSDNPIVSSETSVDVNQNKDSNHHLDTLEKVRNEDDEFEEHSDDDNRYEDDDSEEDSTCDGNSYYLVERQATHSTEDLKQEARIPIQIFIKLLWLRFTGRSSKKSQTPSIKCISEGSGNSSITFKSDNIIHPDCVYWVNTDAYFRKEGSTAGYGAIVRDNFGNPIVACSGNSNPSSLLYHQLEAFEAGLKLAKKLKICKIEMCCNSEQTREVTMRFVDGDIDCPHSFSSSDDNDAICKACVEVFFLYSQIDAASLFPLLNNIKKLSSDLEYSFHINAVERRLNRAADYLAKRAATVEYEEASMFPRELRDILLEDACGRSLNGLPFSSQEYYVTKREIESTE